MTQVRMMRGAMVAAMLCLGVVEVRASAPVTDAYGATNSDRYPYLCPKEPSQPGWPSDDCCDQQEVTANCTAANAAAKTDRANILLVVSDDQDYCLYGFMAGICSQKDSNGDYVSCLSEDACAAAAGGRCVGSSDLGTCDNDGSRICYLDSDCNSGGMCNRQVPPVGAAAPPLRLNDLTCRNRQAKSPKGKNEQGNPDFQWCDRNDSYEKLVNHQGLWFSREGAPCQNGVNGPTPPDADPVAFTPHLDDLASHGAVFPRAYVAGIICKNSRRAMLHGRYLRHLQWLWEDGGGSAECKRNVRSDEHHGCRVDADCTSTGTCEDAHTVAYWLDSDRSSSVNLPASPNEYERFAFAKLDVIKAQRGDFAPDHAGSKTGKGVGKIRCAETDSACQNALTAADPSTVTAYPTQAVFDYPGRSLYDMTQAIDKTMDGNRVQTHPFFIWWGPHMPHDGPKADDFYWAIYDKLVPIGNKISNVHKRAWAHFARVSWFDAALGGVIYHLRRSCTCTGDGTAESLWDNTVVLFLSDQGWLFPGAKGNTHENTQRTPLIINSPTTRTTPAVYQHEMASSVDLLPTALAYAGTSSGEVQYFPGTESNAAEYPLARDLKNWLDTPDPDSWDRRRNLTFGEDLRSSGQGDKDPRDPSPRHIVTRPGLFGVCQYPYNFTQTSNPQWNPVSTSACGDTDVCHVHPCLTTADCAHFGLNGDKSLGACVDADDATTEQDNPDSRWNRCVNRPWVRCDADSDCADPAWCTGSNICDPGTGKTRRGSYNDFRDHWCGTNAPCVPPGVCQPLLLKIEWHSSSAKPFAIWDLDWDPDQRMNLLEHDTSVDYRYMANNQLYTLTDKLSDCMKHFLAQDTSKHYDWKGETASPQCPTGLIGWELP